jgi:hypothetical protein
MGPNLSQFIAKSGFSTGAISIVFGVALVVLTDGTQFDSGGKSLVTFGLTAILFGVGMLFLTVLRWIVLRLTWETGFGVTPAKKPMNGWR